MLGQCKRCGFDFDNMDNFKEEGDGRVYMKLEEGIVCEKCLVDDEQDEKFARMHSLATGHLPGSDECLVSDLEACIEFNEEDLDDEP